MQGLGISLITRKKGLGTNMTNKPDGWGYRTTPLQQEDGHDPLRAFAEERANVGLTITGIKMRRGKIGIFSRFYLFMYWICFSIVLAIAAACALSKIMGAPLLGTWGFFLILGAAMTVLYGVARWWDGWSVADELRKAPSPVEALREEYRQRSDRLRAKLEPPRRAYPLDPDPSGDRSALIIEYIRAHEGRLPLLAQALEAYDKAVGDEARAYACADVIYACDALDEEARTLERIWTGATPRGQRDAWPDVVAYLAGLKEACGRAPVAEEAGRSRAGVRGDFSEHDRANDEGATPATDDYVDEHFGLPRGKKGVPDGEGYGDA